MQFQHEVLQWQGLPTFHHGIIFDWITGNRKQMLTTYLSDLHVRTFSHSKTCVTNQNISRWYKHVFQKANLSFEKKFKFLKLFSSRKPEIWLELRCNSGNNKLQSYKVNPFTLYSLWVRFFLPIGHIDQGMTHLRRLCVTVGTDSQISYMLT